MPKGSYFYLIAYDTKNLQRMNLGSNVRVFPLSRTELLAYVADGDVQKVRRIPGVRRIVLQFDVNPDLCTGCNNCVSACPANFDELAKDWDEPPTSNNYVLRVSNGKLSVNRLDKCRRITGDKNCKTCTLACPFNIIEIKS